MGAGARTIQTFAEFIVIGIAVGAVYGLIAFPLSLIWNTTHNLDFAVGGYAVVGGIAAAAIGTPLGAAYGILLGAVFGGVVGLAFLIIQARGASGTLAPILVSVGLLFALVSFTQWRYGTDPVYVNVIPGVYEVVGLRIARSSVLNIGFVAAATVVLVLVFRKTKIGRWMRACAVSPEDAPLVGIPVRSIQVATFVLSGVMSAIAGLLLVASQGLIFDAGFKLAVLGIGALLVFGMRGPLSALAGGLTLGVVESLSVLWLPERIAPVSPFLFLLIILSIGTFDVKTGVARP